jgi:hypothetical protein
MKYAADMGSGAYAADMGSGAVIVIPSLIKDWFRNSEADGGNTQTAC